MKKRKLIFSVAGLIVIIAGFVFYNNSNADEGVNKIYETSQKEAAVENQTIITTLTAAGEVKSANTEKLTLNTSYSYLTMCAEENEMVKKGSNILKYTNGTYITAPYDCVITGYSVPTAKSTCTESNYVEISSVEDLYMDINIGEDQIGNIAVGQEVKIVVNSDDSKEFTGTISKINDIGTYSRSGTTFAAIASIKNDGTLKLGMSASCTITISKKENIACLPIESVQIEDNKKYVNLVDNSGNTNKTEIETGVSDANYVEIVSGVSLGDKVNYETTTVTVTESSDKNSSNALTSLFGGNKGGGPSMNKGGFQR